MRAYEGGCHCGAIHARFESEIDPERIEVRACQCSFCVRRGMKAISDPNGRLTLRFDDGKVRRSRSGTRMADFLICAECGDFIAAVSDDVGVLNVVGAAIQPFAGREATAKVFDGETNQSRAARWRAGWTPVVLEAAQ